MSTWLCDTWGGEGAVPVKSKIVNVSDRHRSWDTGATHVVSVASESWFCFGVPLKKKKIKRPIWILIPAGDNVKNFQLLLKLCTPLVVLLLFSFCPFLSTSPYPLLLFFITFAFFSMSYYSVSLLISLPLFSNINMLRVLKLLVQFYFTSLKPLLPCYLSQQFTSCSVTDQSACKQRKESVDQNPSLFFVVVILARQFGESD